MFSVMSLAGDRQSLASEYLVRGWISSEVVAR
jgi:hypothetical protein